MQLKKVEKRDGITENLARDVNQAFQKALNRTYADADQISMCLHEDGANLADPDDGMQSVLKAIRLNFNVKWPLHLFFSPRVLEQYNELFSFLLQIRQLQNELHSVWRLHRDFKIPGNSMLSQLRNKMLFLIDNLLYYLQVDVIESHFCILLNAVQCSKDFEIMQRAHNIFQANILSLSFLINIDTNGSTNGKTNVPHHRSDNPVLRILNNIFKTITLFCNFNELTEDKMSAETQHLAEMFEAQ